MAMVLDEEEIYKCLKHPAKRRRITGVCPRCLRDRLNNLCPDCANLRPCACYPTTSFSSSSSSFSRSSSTTDGRKFGIDMGSVGRMSHLIDGEPSIRRSRSVAFPFLRRKLDDKDPGGGLPPSGNKSRSSPWSIFKNHRTKGKEEEEEEEVDENVAKMIRSKSVGIFYRRDNSNSSGRDSRMKRWGLNFPSPMKVFRQSKTAKVVQEG